MGNGGKPFYFYLFDGSALWLCQMVHIAYKSSLLQSCTRKTRLLDVVYNASNNELVSTLSTSLLFWWLRKVHLKVAQ